MKIKSEGAARLIEEYRGDILENVHDGYIVIVNDQGKIVHSIGDPKAVCYYRSASKPLQALPVIALAIDKMFGFSDTELAIMAASHRGESYHITAVEGILAKIGCTEEDLCMLPTWPSQSAAREAVIATGEGKRKVYHNCSGKHAAILSIARYLGVSTENYWEVDHPAQKVIRQTISMFTEIPYDEIGVGIDGCGVPVFAVPMQNMALGAMKLACPDRIADSSYALAAERLGKIISQYPLYITGTDYICSMVNMDPNLFAKGGAKGVYTIGMREQRLGIAFKVRDGSEDTWPIIINEIFAQIGYFDEAGRVRMNKLAGLELINDNNEVVGIVQSVFDLNRK